MSSNEATRCQHTPITRGWVFRYGAIARLTCSRDGCDPRRVNQGWKLGAKLKGYKITNEPIVPS